jgi:hypothetical protein
MPKARLMLIPNTLGLEVGKSFLNPKKPNPKKAKPLKKAGTKAKIQTIKPEPRPISPYNFNHIHKRFMVLYELSDMRQVWKKVRSEFKKENKIELPKRFQKYPELWEMLNDWMEQKITNFVKSGGEDVAFYNKSDLKLRGWDDKIILRLYPKPDKVMYLGRGRYAYYYSGTRLGELEDGDEFLEHITAKLERQRKRAISKSNKSKLISEKFGSEFVG